MRLVLYEWCCSGGLHGPQAASLLAETAAESLLTEGRLMLESLAQEASNLPGAEVIVLVDDELPASVAPQLPQACRRQPVPAGTAMACLLEQAAAADSLLMVAPETAGILVDHLNQIEEAALGPRLAGGSARFAAAAADKQLTCQLLAGGGIPVPAGCSLPAGAQLPSGFHLPAIQKARDSAGGDGLVLVETAANFQPATMPTRIETQVSGVPVGVCCLCGPDGMVPLLPLEQRFAAGPGTAYLGGQPLAPALRPRATQLAIRSIETLARSIHAPVRGWVGVDMMLGARADGRADRVLEINPRLTTSFVGLAHGYDGGVLAALLASAAGQPVSLGSCNESACCFRLS